jgi:hypothetical protein
MSRKSERHLSGPLPVWPCMLSVCHHAGGGGNFAGVVAPARDSDAPMGTQSNALELDEALGVARLLVAATVRQELPTPICVWVLRRAHHRRRRWHRCCACADPCREKWRSDHYGIAMNWRFGHVVENQRSCCLWIVTCWQHRHHHGKDEEQCSMVGSHSHGQWDAVVWWFCCRLFSNAYDSERGWGGLVL